MCNGKRQRVKSRPISGNLSEFLKISAPVLQRMASSSSFTFNRNVASATLWRQLGKCLVFTFCSGILIIERVQMGL